MRNEDIGKTQEQIFEELRNKTDALEDTVKTLQEKVYKIEKKVGK